jgi:hypothetical protein
MAPDGTNFATLHTFTDADGHPQALIQGSDGTLYGTAYENNQGTIFRLAPEQFYCPMELRSSTGGRKQPQLRPAASHGWDILWDYQFRRRQYLFRHGVSDDIDIQPHRAALKTGGACTGGGLAA